MSARLGWIAIAALICVGLFALGRGEPAGAEPGASVEAPAATPGAGEKIDVLLCDDETKVTVVAQANPKRADGERVAQELMAQWRSKHPHSDWEADERRAHQLVPSADNSQLVGNPQGATYSQVTEREVLVWKTETERFALSGSRIFHDGDELGSTIAVSCDMCHPDAANTHPETYPKYQVQLGRTVLLRDMINWCIEHPVRGKKLAEDDPKMRALGSVHLRAAKGRAARLRATLGTSAAPFLFEGPVALGFLGVRRVRAAEELRAAARDETTVGRPQGALTPDQPLARDRRVAVAEQPLRLRRGAVELDRQIEVRARWGRSFRLASARFNLQERPRLARIPRRTRSTRFSSAARCSCAT